MQDDIAQVINQQNTTSVQAENTNPAQILIDRISQENNFKVEGILHKYADEAIKLLAENKISSEEYMLIAVNIATKADAFARGWMNNVLNSADSMSSEKNDAQLKCIEDLRRLAREMRRYIINLISSRLLA